MYAVCAGTRNSQEKWEMGFKILSSIKFIDWEGEKQKLEENAKCDVIISVQKTNELKEIISTRLEECTYWGTVWQQHVGKNYGGGFK